MWPTPLIFGTSEFDLSQNSLHFPKSLSSGSTHNLSLLSWIILAFGVFCYCFLLFRHCRSLDLLSKIAFMKRSTISQFPFEKQYKVVNYVLFLSDFPIGKKELAYLQRVPRWKYDFAQMEILFCGDGNMNSLRWKYHFFLMEILFCSDGNVILFRWFYFDGNIILPSFSWFD